MQEVDPAGVSNLPAHLQHIANTWPPYVPFKKGCELAGLRKTGMYNEIEPRGPIKAVKRGRLTQLETMSILFFLARLPKADIKPIPNRPEQQRGKRKLASGATPADFDAERPRKPLSRSASPELTR